MQLRHEVQTLLTLLNESRDRLCKMPSTRPADIVREAEHLAAVAKRYQSAEQKYREFLSSLVREVA